MKTADAYKINEEKWWYIPKHDVSTFLKDPKEEKIYNKRKLYYFEFEGQKP